MTMKMGKNEKHEARNTGSGPDEGKVVVRVLSVGQTTGVSFALPANASMSATFVIAECTAVVRPDKECRSTDAP
jgi:hypothetical protein